MYIGSEAIAEVKIVSLSNDLNPMREVALAPHMFLESSTGSPPAVYFSVEECHCQEALG